MFISNNLTNTVSCFESCYFPTLLIITIKYIKKKENTALIWFSDVDSGVFGLERGAGRLGDGDDVATGFHGVNFTIIGSSSSYVIDILNSWFRVADAAAAINADTRFVIRCCLWWCCCMIRAPHFTNCDDIVHIMSHQKVFYPSIWCIEFVWCLIGCRTSSLSSLCTMLIL